jgi:hypothetical protein
VSLPPDFNRQFYSPFQQPSRLPELQVDNLRLILIVLGLIILAAIVLFHRPAGESRRNHARWLASRREPASAMGIRARVGRARPK